ncbi:DUF2267 domain-containing protein [Sphingomicrobium lutaoense]|uniref:Uncharacterized protein (DUF2267 family) n=1 Tax=Sphingomicrobium lutaoense TaxID=515949 RepID=A0A839Z5G9_9SPHN|nr:DUF2267 domain-containing protein [Sphingomicrobium lutaoense]MBB3764915.1 uncharacterized protein (DUF2267 family) [Sphingomicrobium lutaoense]
MATTGLDLFDKTIHTTNIWLKEIMGQIGPDRQTAWKVLTTVLRALRDRLTPELASHLSAQLPLIVRGGYYDLYQPGHERPDVHTEDQFIDEVRRGLSDSRGVDPRDAIRAVFMVLDEHISKGEVEKVRQALPKSIRDLWPENIAMRPPMMKAGL